MPAFTRAVVPGNLDENPLIDADTGARVRDNLERRRDRNAKKLENRNRAIVAKKK